MTKEKKEAYETKPKVQSTELVKTQQHDVFIIVEKNGQCLIALGDKIVSKNTFATIEEAQNYIDSKPWELIINATCAVWEIVVKQTQKKL